MKLLWGIVIFLYFVLITFNILRLYQLYQLEKQIKRSQKEKPQYEIWLDEMTF